MQIILDLGSGNTCQNGITYLKKMMDEIKKVDNGTNEIILKMQLWDEPIGENIKLDWNVFAEGYEYAKELGYQMTASVFDKASLYFLAQFDVPFVKIANSKDYAYLAEYVPRKYPIYFSNNSYNEKEFVFGMDRVLYCKSDYPASVLEYYDAYKDSSKKQRYKELQNGHVVELTKTIYWDGISDHTVGTDLVKKIKPAIWEKHFKLTDSKGLDAGTFAITPKQLGVFLNESSVEISE